MSATGDLDPRQLAREAAQWLALQDAGELSESQRADLQRWCERSAAHEALWQKAQTLRQRFAQVPPSLAVACLDRPGLDRRRLLGQALLLGTLAPLAWLGYPQLPVQGWRADLRTATGERRSLTLADGSRLQLNTASAVNLGQHEGQPRLQLVQGEIAVHGRGPLQVQTRDGLLQGNGADFCVRQTAQGCRVWVRRAALELRPTQGAPLRLGAGEQALLSATAVTDRGRFDPQLPGWQQGVLIVDDRPLGDVLRELDRYRPGVLRWDPALERLAVTGTFRLDDTDQVLALLAATLPVTVHYRTRYWVSLTPRQKIT